MPVQPIIQEIDYLEPMDALAATGGRTGTVFLDSAAPDPELGRWSWLGVDPFGNFRSVDGRAAWSGAPLDGHPIEALRGVLERFRCIGLPDLPFGGGASGYLSYEAGRLLERLPQPKWRGAPWPEIELWFHDVGIAFDLLQRRAFVVSTGDPETKPEKRGERALARAAWLLRTLKSESPAGPAEAVHLGRDAWRANVDEAGFKGMVERARELIAAGDIFQANLAQAFRAELPGTVNPLQLYRQLRSANPAPFGAFVATPERIIASTSPEGFLRLRDGVVETRPIKGTRRRSPDPRTDHRMAQELLASVKDRAENVMIVDLMRNDLSRVCLPGSVEVPVLCGLESYASVHHLVSVVRGRLKPGMDALHLLSACFPGGSVTGAPKIRAMEIIHELEPEARGPYCGSILHLGFDGSLRSNIAIRTMVVEGNVASVHAGGGITLLSDPQEEYAETLVKAERMLGAFDVPAAGEFLA
jgi:para-aminobenzoate synthetase component 1